MQVYCLMGRKLWATCRQPSCWTIHQGFVWIMSRSPTMWSLTKYLLFLPNLTSLPTLLHCARSFDNSNRVKVFCPSAELTLLILKMFSIKKAHSSSAGKQVHTGRSSKHQYLKFFNLMQRDESCTGNQGTNTFWPFGMLRDWMQWNTAIFGKKIEWDKL